MKIWALARKLRLITIPLICTLFSMSISAQPVKPLELKSGLWEGINSSLKQYNILELNEDGQHRFFHANMATAFRRTELFTFSDEQITCTNSECTINIIIRNDEITRLIISPYLEESFKVLEINADAKGQAIFTQTYQLDKTKKHSIVRTFIKKYRSRIESLTGMQSDGIYGFWLGVLNLDDRFELVSLEMYPDKKSTLTRFINGQSSSYEVSFLPEDVMVVQGVTYIETDHSTFANKLIIHPGNGSLSGYMYSIYKEHTLQTGTFSLLRIK